ncbi:MAG: ImmA/IrrE family metallo-endopeptidase [Candidatus Cybelea sp.]
MRNALKFDVAARSRMPTWAEALRAFIGQADDLGVLVAVNGVVGNNTHRRLDPGEFRGFALSDGVAPMVFVNGADSKAAQMFTLAHELAHIWLGESALSDPDKTRGPVHATERWANEVAAEMLVPRSAFQDIFDQNESLDAALHRIARHFKVSTLVVLRRIRDLGEITAQEFWSAYDAELQRLRAVRRGAGGDFYLTESARVGKRFGRALIASTLEGNTLYRDAMRMLGISKVETFHEFSHSLGIG